MNFAITGLGRSGTKSLSLALAINHSNTEVHHELDRELVTDVCKVRNRFKSNYGEVSSYLRFCLLDLPVDKRAVIIRHPSAILRSALSRECGTTKTKKEWISHINAGLAGLDRLIKHGVHVIRFEKMVSCEQYRQLEIYDWLGLKCETGIFPHEGESKSKVNAESIGLPWQFNWFVSAYYGSAQ